MSFRPRLRPCCGRNDVLVEGQEKKKIGSWISPKHYSPPWRFKKNRHRKINQKSWHEDVECSKTYYLFFFWKQKFYMELLFSSRSIFKIERNLKLLFDSSVFEALYFILYFTKLFSNFHQSSLFPHYVYFDEILVQLFE